VKNQAAQDLQILTVALFIQVLLLVRASFAGLFSAGYVGYSLLAVLFLALFGILIFSERILFSSRQAKLLRSFSTPRINLPKSRNIFLFSILLIVLAGLVLRGLVILTVPINVLTADMLPLIEKAVLALQAGQNPYHVYYFPYPMPLTFLPGLWLPYYPLVALGLDPRWIGLLIWLLISVGLVWIILETGTKQPSPFYFLLGAINLAILQFSPDLISFHAIGHTFTLWLWLTLVCFGIYKGWDVLTAVGLGLVLSSRQTAVVFPPILLFYWFSRGGLRAALKYGGISAAVFLLLNLPFAIQSPAQVFLAPLAHYQELAAWDFTRGPVSFMANSVGFSYVLQTWLGPGILSFFYGLVLLASIGLSPYLVKKRKRMLLGLAAVLAWFNLFTPIAWTYIYYDSLIILAFALVIQSDRPAGDGTTGAATK
jgi:hypothetical protein